jgi:uncharacterized membrane-anchored protein YjiN (DUF445 family)
MITYTLTRPKMVEYLESKLNQLTAEITTLETELGTAVSNYVIALDNLGNYLRYELNDPSATLITDVVTEAAKENQHSLITRFVRSWLGPVTYNYYLDVSVNLNSIEQDLIKHVRRHLYRLLSYTNDKLRLDENSYTFSYYYYELRTCDEFAPLRKLWDKAVTTSTSAVSIQSSLKELQCKSLTLTQELQLASLSKEVTFQLVSECKL